MVLRWSIVRRTRLDLQSAHLRLRAVECDVQILTVDPDLGPRIMLRSHARLEVPERRRRLRSGPRGVVEPAVELRGFSNRLAMLLEELRDDARAFRIGTGDTVHSRPLSVTSGILTQPTVSSALTAVFTNRFGLRALPHRKRKAAPRALSHCGRQDVRLGICTAAWAPYHLAAVASLRFRKYWGSPTIPRHCPARRSMASGVCLGAAIFRMAGSK